MRQEHQCPKECEEKGICKIVTEPTADSSQTFQRFPCCIIIPPYKFEHDGKHVHETKKPHLCNDNCPNDEGQHIKEEEYNQDFHFCDVKCPNCFYYCTLPYGHYEKYYTKHSTTHGNMSLTTFACEDDEDSQVCSNLAKKEGLYEHIKVNISPKPDEAKDYISHWLFWERTMFEDPYSKGERD
ncbi:6709_t:CDS:2 [Diversispora eburnea]|uniref:6709_t:CDS:1 n=1 Tax=Diversispora eburnea TaxID=1213867 RepID=A0A9N8ZTA7_9GLOM|nr:6709_t:CDS:2 [Diversispora eburnea]